MAVIFDLAGGFAMFSHFPNVVRRDLPPSLAASAFLAVRWWVDAAFFRGDHAQEGGRWIVRPFGSVTSSGNWQLAGKSRGMFL